MLRAVLGESVGAAQTLETDCNFLEFVVLAVAGYDVLCDLPRLLLWVAVGGEVGVHDAGVFHLSHGMFLFLIGSHSVC